jgi:hypothetical protein
LGVDVERSGDKVIALGQAQSQAMSAPNGATAAASNNPDTQTALPSGGHEQSPFGKKSGARVFIV